MCELVPECLRVLLLVLVPPEAVVLVRVEPGDGGGLYRLNVAHAAAVGHDGVHDGRIRGGQPLQGVDRGQRRRRHARRGQRGHGGRGLHHLIGEGETTT